MYIIIFYYYYVKVKTRHLHCLHNTNNTNANTQYTIHYTLSIDRYAPLSPTPYIFAFLVGSCLLGILYDTSRRILHSIKEVSSVSVCQPVLQCYSVTELWVHTLV